MAWGYIIFAAFVIVAASNAVNLTDGLDGLAIGPVIIAAATYMFFAYVAGHIKISNYLQINYVAGSGEVAIFCGTLAGAGMGFLWFNSYPAQIFMGDVGSLSLGAALGTIAVHHQTGNPTGAGRRVVCHRGVVGHFPGQFFQNDQRPAHFADGPTAPSF